MKITKKLKKPHLAIFFSFLIIFASCEQYKLDEENLNSFDYSIHEEFISNQYNIDVIDIIYSDSDKTTISMEISSSSELLDVINNYYNSNMSLPNDFLKITENNSIDITNTLIKKGWINSNDVKQIDNFIGNFSKFGFNSALERYENSVIKMNLNQTEFQIKNKFANALMTINHINPNLFDVHDKYTGNTYFMGGSCLRAALALVAASIALASCATIIACGLAVSAWILAYDAYRDNCLGVDNANNL